MNYPEPKTPIDVVNLDGISFNDATHIQRATGIDPYACGRGELLYVLGWWAVHRRPEYRGITLDNVQQWRGRAFNLVAADDDANDIAEALALSTEADADALPTTAAPEPERN